MKKSDLPVITLKPGRENSLYRFHPWVFSGAIQNKPSDAEEGDIVELRSHRGELLGKGFYLNADIAVKVFEFRDMTIDRDYWFRKFKMAFDFRTQLGLTRNPTTTMYRLIHSEGDGIPGLIADYYNKTVVLQGSHAGIFRLREMFASILTELYQNDLNVIYDKSDHLVKKSSVEHVVDPCLYGIPLSTNASENGVHFMIDYIKGQKTGFFIDQRENRKILGQFCKGKMVLNTFSYTGGFSMYALENQAEKVVSVDVSGQAMELLDENLRLNGFDPARHDAVVEDVKVYLNDLTPGEFDIIILDPPAFAKSHKVSHNALQGYKYINRLAISKIKDNGLIFTFSCSQAIDRAMFRSMVQSAAIEAGRNVRVIGSLSQGPDHPVSIFHPEGEYLKGLIIQVN